MSAVQKLYPVIPKPTGFLHYQALETIYRTHTQSDKNNTNEVGSLWDWGSLEISTGLCDLFELMRHTTATANYLLTLRHTVKLSTQDDAGFFFGV